MDYWASASSAFILITLSLLLPRLVAILRTVQYEHKTVLKYVVLPPPEAVESNLEVVKEPDAPNEWWTSAKVFALEERAIFSKAWLYATHKSSFVKPGDYRSMKVPGGFPIFLIKGKDDQIRAFHNVCRHRAYTVTTKTAGSSLVLGCKYHGWSYDTQGKLVKAPKFDEVDGFLKEANSLFEIRTSVDSNGLVFVNLDTSSAAAPFDLREQYMNLDAISAERWEIMGKFNWKTADLDQTLHIPSLTSLSTTQSLTKKVTAALGLPIARLQRRVSPLSWILMSPSGDSWLSIALLPTSPSTTTVHCVLYSSSGRADKSIRSLNKLQLEMKACVARLESAYKAIISKGQHDLSNLPRHIEWTRQIAAHVKLERASGKLIHPAARADEISAECRSADDLCKELETPYLNGIKPLDAMDSLSW